MIVTSFDEYTKLRQQCPYDHQEADAPTADLVQGDVVQKDVDNCFDCSCNVDAHEAETEPNLMIPFQILRFVVSAIFSSASSSRLWICNIPVA